jgi:hypothetical protein
MDKLKFKDNNYSSQNMPRFPINRLNLLKYRLMQKKIPAFGGANYLFQNENYATGVPTTIRFSRILALLPLRWRW